MIKRCIVCGETFESKRKKQKVCSKACAPKAKSAKKNQDGSIQSYEEMFNDFYKGKFRYVSGYLGIDSTITCECIMCGNIRESGARCIYEVHKIRRCSICAKEKTKELNKARAAEKAKVIEKAKKERKNLKDQRDEFKRAEALLTRTITMSCEECGVEFNTTNLLTKYCSNRCSKKHERRVHDLTRRHKLKENGHIDYSITLEKLIQRDDGICALCGSVVNRDDYIMDGDTYIVNSGYPSIDHIVPVSKGGTHTWDNVQLAHMICNSKKGAIYD